MSSKRRAVSDRTRSLLKEEVSNVCPLCGRFERTGDEFTAHHINHDPGVSEYWNLVLLCSDCHDDLSKHRTDGTRGRRVRLVKRRLFRSYFGPTAVNAMRLAWENSVVVASPVDAVDLCVWGFMRIKRRNVMSVGPVTGVSTFDAYELTPEGRTVWERVFGPAREGGSAP